jgi:hypothetical protein
MDLVLEWLAQPAIEPDQPLSRSDAAAVFMMILGHLVAITDRMQRDVDIQAIPVPM